MPAKVDLAMLADDVKRRIPVVLFDAERGLLVLRELAGECAELVAGDDESPPSEGAVPRGEPDPLPVGGEF